MSETAPAGLWFIDDAENLDRFVALLADAPVVPIDTEFERRRTYFAELCLLQVAAAGRFACIDTLASGPVGPLMAALARPGSVTVLHSARQDLEVLYQAGGILPDAVFDTQVAAAMAGFPEQVGYAGLVQELLGVELAKSQTRTDWRSRPLTAAQLEYAVDDVRYLDPLRSVLAERLDRLGRLDWLREDCAALLEPALYEPDPDSAWQRIKGLGRLSEPEFARAAALAAWRERQAVASNLPRMWVLKDPALLALATVAPRDRPGLEAAADLAGGTLRRHADELLRVLADPPAPPARAPHRVPDDAQRRASRALAARARDIAGELDIPSSLLVTRREIDQIVLDRTPGRLLSGWRAPLLADAISGRGPEPTAAGAG